MPTSIDAGKGLFPSYRFEAPLQDRVWSSAGILVRCICHPFMHLKIFLV